jgi:hypothetical protein
LADQPVGGVLFAALGQADAFRGIGGKKPIAHRGTEDSLGETVRFGDGRW